MSESVLTEHTTVLVQLKWAGFKQWRDFCRTQYELTLRKKWSRATIEKWFAPRFEKLFKSRLRPGAYYEFSSEEFQEIFQGQTETKLMLREWSNPADWDMVVPYIDRPLPPTQLFGDVRYM